MDKGRVELRGGLEARTLARLQLGDDCRIRDRIISWIASMLLGARQEVDGGYLWGVPAAVGWDCCCCQETIEAVSRLVRDDSNRNEGGNSYDAICENETTDGQRVYGIWK